MSPEVLISEGTVLLFGFDRHPHHERAVAAASFAPLDRLIRLMEDVDLQRPGQRLPDTGQGTVRNLVQAFNAMLSRLEAERRRSSAHALAAQEAQRHRIAPGCTTKWAKG